MRFLTLSFALFVLALPVYGQVDADDGGIIPDLVNKMNPELTTTITNEWLVNGEVVETSWHLIEFGGTPVWFSDDEVMSDPRLSAIHASAHGSTSGMYVTEWTCDLGLHHTVETARKVGENEQSWGARHQQNVNALLALFPIPEQTSMLFIGGMRLVA